RHTRSKRDWSSDVCSSDLAALLEHREALGAGAHFRFDGAEPQCFASVVLERSADREEPSVVREGARRAAEVGDRSVSARDEEFEIGRASCRERVYIEVLEE